MNGELHDLSDRELLVLTAQTVRDTNERIRDHEKRLRWLERLAYGLMGAWTFVTAWLGIHVAGGHSK